MAASLALALLAGMSSSSFVATQRLPAGADPLTLAVLNSEPKFYQAFADSIEVNGRCGKKLGVCTSCLCQSWGPATGPCYRLTSVAPGEKRTMPLVITDYALSMPILCSEVRLESSNLAAEN